jgi:hypothetical protein
VPARPAPTSDQHMDALSALLAKKENSNNPKHPRSEEKQYSFLASKVSVILTKNGVAITYPI